MHNEGASRVFGWVSIIVAVCSFYFGFQSHNDTALFVSLVAWGSVFLIVGVLLLIVGRVF